MSESLAHFLARKEPRLAMPSSHVPYSMDHFWVAFAYYLRNDHLRETKPTAYWDKWR